MTRPAPEGRTGTAGAARVTVLPAPYAAARVPGTGIPAAGTAAPHTGGPYGDAPYAVARTAVAVSVLRPQLP